MKNADKPASPIGNVNINMVDRSCLGLTKLEHFAATLPHLDFQLGTIDDLCTFIGRKVDEDDPEDVILATAQFEAKLRVIRAKAHLEELEK